MLGRAGPTGTAAEHDALDQPAVFAGRDGAGPALARPGACAAGAASATAWASTPPPASPASSRWRTACASWRSARGSWTALPPRRHAGRSPWSEDRLAGLLGGRLSPWRRSTRRTSASSPARSPPWRPSPGACAAEGIACRRLPTSHAFHSPEMAPAAEGLRRLLATSSCARPPSPRSPTSPAPGSPTADATDPGYWVRHLLGTVRFAEGLRTLVAGARPRAAGGRPRPRALHSGACSRRGAANASPSPRCARSTTRGRTTPSCPAPWAASGSPAWTSTGTAFHAGRAAPQGRPSHLPVPAPALLVRPAPEPGASGPLAEAVPAEPAPPPTVRERRGLRAPWAEPHARGVEEAVAAVWREILHVEPVGRHDSFFELGGHSLLAPRVLLRVQPEPSASTSRSPALLAAPTVAELAARWRSRQRGGAAGGREPGARSGAPRPCSIPRSARTRRTLGDLADPGGRGAHRRHRVPRRLSPARAARPDPRHRPLPGAGRQRRGGPRAPAATNLAALRLRIPDEARSASWPCPATWPRPAGGSAEEAFRALAGARRGRLSLRRLGQLHLPLPRR